MTQSQSQRQKQRQRQRQQFINLFKFSLSDFVSLLQMAVNVIGGGQRCLLKRCHLEIRCKVTTIGRSDRYVPMTKTFILNTNSMTSGEVLDSSRPICHEFVSRSHRYVTVCVQN